MRHYYVAGLEKENETLESKITELEAKLAEAQRGYAAVGAAFLTRGTELTALRALCGEAARLIADHIGGLIRKGDKHATRIYDRLEAASGKR